MEEADRLTQEHGRNVRVVGWFHSHPHITVLPSAVDLRTQGNFQQLDARFFGLIISVFSEDADSTQRIRAVTFQSSRREAEQAASWEHHEVPLSIVPSSAVRRDGGNGSGSSPSTLLRLIFAEERARYLTRLASANSVLERKYVSSVYEQQLTRLLEYSVAPVVRAKVEGKR